MELGLALDNQIDRVVGQKLCVVVDECRHVGDLNILVNVGKGCLGCVHCWELDVGIRLIFSAADGQGGVEGIKSRVVFIVVRKVCGLFQVEGGCSRV